MPNIQIALEYEGTNYYGWQHQKNTPYTIQDIVENALSKVLREKVKVTAAGRTDSGVHAQAQIANFITKSRTSPSKLQYSVNCILPEDIKITAIRVVRTDFHSRYSAKSKTYRYTILNRGYPAVFLRNRAYFYPRHHLNIRLMQEATGYLIGEHDFTSFKNGADGGDKSCVRNIKSIKIKKDGDFIYLDFAGNGFLRNMIRNIAGTLIQVGEGTLRPGAIKRILYSKNRKLAGPTAPACGLCLLKVGY
jgi:tRNA pseudouridine38-40 synthase